MNHWIRMALQQGPDPPPTKGLAQKHHQTSAGMPSVMRFFAALGLPKGIPSGLPL
jgi:hypothetical protein